MRDQVEWPDNITVANAGGPRQSALTDALGRSRRSVLALGVLVSSEEDP